jgi:hypothetical protein
MRVISSSVAPPSGRRASLSPRICRSPPSPSDRAEAAMDLVGTGGRNVSVRGICKKIHVVPDGPHTIEKTGSSRSIALIRDTVRACSMRSSGRFFPACGGSIGGSPSNAGAPDA